MEGDETSRPDETPERGLDVPEPTAAERRWKPPVPHPACRIPGAGVLRQIGFDGVRDFIDAVVSVVIHGAFEAARFATGSRFRRATTA